MWKTLSNFKKNKKILILNYFYKVEEFIEKQEKKDLLNIIVWSFLTIRLNMLLMCLYNI